MVDECIAKQFVLSQRYVVFVHEGQFQADEFFRAGVRYVIDANYSPGLGFLVVLAAERGLNKDAAAERPAAAVKEALESQPNTGGESVFDSSDQLFLQALKISQS